MCCVDNEKCAYGDCANCCKLQFHFEREIDDSGNLNFFQWESMKKSYLKDGITKEVKVTTKIRKTVLYCITCDSGALRSAAATGKFAQQAARRAMW